ncbi:GAF domain-containing protein [Nakamurella sp. A5-74]|uniref:GAF domain-containing protein n=1 Tax=Nakamurella sp. A5-74 TaxID=3158264 RepID=A0AAU8DPE0_9ACTN
MEQNEDTILDVLERFDSLWEQRMTLGRLPAVLLADALAATAAEVLDADGVGITVLAGNRLRVPIGASGPVASAAERLQFTVGDGPCFRVFDDRHTALFNGSALDEQFPTFFDGLTRHTPFRSIVATPLGMSRPWGMLDAYHRSSHPDDAAPSVRAIGNRVTAVLTETSAVAEAIGNRPDPDYKAPWDDRMHVWQATGMTGLALDVDMSNALALLRGAAFSAEMDIDELAAEIIAGTRNPRDLVDAD